MTRHSIPALLLPLLLSLTVPLHVMAENPGYAFFEDFVSVAGWFVLIAVVALLIGLAVWRDILKASVFAAGMTLLLTANMLFRQPLLWFGISAEDTRRLLVQIPLHVGWTVLLAYIVTRVDNLRAVLQGGLLAVLVFLLFDAGRIVFAQGGGMDSDVETLQLQSSPAKESEGLMAATPGGGTRPDIFVILLDGYGRQDVLRNFYDVDNSEFISFLRDEGFDVTDRSCTNYNQTLLSMSALLGMKYLDTTEYRGATAGEIRDVLKRDIMSSTVPRILRRAGYRVFLDQTWNGFIRPGSGTLDVTAQDAFPLYRSVLREGSSRPFFEKVLRVIGILDIASGNERIRDHIIQQFDRLPLYSHTDIPVFVFMHIVSPHPPFVLGPFNQKDIAQRPVESYDGSFFYEETGRSLEEYRLRYASQVVELTRLAEQAIRRLLRVNDTAIVVLLSDHGPGSLLDQDSMENTTLEERFPILHAVRVPGADSTLFYPDITPVNSFRRIFHHLFAADSATLPDRSYFAPWGTMFPLRDVSSNVRHDPLF